MKDLPAVLLIPFLFFLFGCQTAVTYPQNSTNIPQKNSTTTLNTSVSQNTSTPAPEPTALPPEALTPIPTHLPAPIITLTLAVPPAWLAAAQSAVTQVPGQYQWQIVTAGNPESLFKSGRADIAVIKGGDGVIFFSDPLVIAVPFTAAWEDTSLIEAEKIISEGHPQAWVIPWRDLTPDLKPVRVDGHSPTDPEYPLQQSFSILSAPKLASAGEALAGFLKQEMMDPLVTLTAVGDIMLGRGLGWILSQGNFDYPFVNVQEILVGSDLTLGNLESSLGSMGQEADKKYPFQAPPEAAISLARSGFDILSLANNHAMDYGPDALRQAHDLLANQGVSVIGIGEDETAAHEPLIQSINGLTLAFLAYVNVPVEASSGFDTALWAAAGSSPGVAWADPLRMQLDVAHAKQKADLVIVNLHSGLEYIEAPSEVQTAAAHAAIDAGAALVIGHHSHILQGVEFYKAGVIAYSLGNFAFNIEGPPETAVLKAWLDQSGVRQIEFQPAIIQSTGQPRLAEPAEAKTILENIFRLTTLLNPGRW